MQRSLALVLMAVLPAGFGAAPRNSEGTKTTPSVAGHWPAASQPTKVPAVRQMELVVNHSEVVTSPKPIKRAAVANPEIADVTVLSPVQVLLAGKKPGVTQVILWDEQDVPTTLSVFVTGDKTLLEAEIQRLFPTSRVRVSVAQAALVLSGTVEDAAQARAIVRLAEAFVPRVINNLVIPGAKQVLLKVRVSEISRSKLRRLGINAVYASPDFFIEHSTNDLGSFAPGIPAGVVTRGDPTFSHLSPATAGPNSNVSFGVADMRMAVFLDALKENGIITVLAEPNLVAVSGQKASFLVGGEFPVPVPQDEDTITIMFREYGIRLQFVATILEDGNIRLEVEPEVSDLDFSVAIEIAGFVVPGLIQRRVNTAVELKSGQTFVIAGLISKSILATKSGVPVLGELPVVGAAFSSSVHREEETELLVLVTPQLVDPLASAQVPAAPTDHIRPPTDVELYLLGLMEAPADKGPVSSPEGPKPTIPVLRGPTGQQMN